MKCFTLPTVSSSPRHRAVYLAAAALVLAAVVAVAVAVPVSRTGPAGAIAADGDAGLAEARQLAAAQRAAPRVRKESGQSSTAADACQGVAGLCKVPVRLVTFPGTHNSNALKTNFANLAESQKLTFFEQLQAGARMFDLDFAGGRFGPRFGHCLSCFCVFSEVDSENDPVKVFKTMADFLAANPREVLVIGLSNINCGDKNEARQQLLGVLAASPLLNYISLQPIGPTTTLGDLVERNQRAILLFYDEWVTPSGYKVGGKFVPNQALWRIYGEGTSVDGKDPVTIDNQVSQGLLTEVVKQISAPQPALSPTTTWRIMGLFPSSCLVCRTAGVCGSISCAEKANSESFVMYIRGKTTTRWTRNRGDQTQLVPAFNGFQIDYLQPTPRANVVSAAQKLNQALAWMYTTRPAQAPQLGLGNCVWLLDDTAAAGGLVCVADAAVKVQSVLGLPAAVPARGRLLLQQQQQPGGSGSGGSGGKRHMLVPANPALIVRVFADGKMRREIKGAAGQAQLLDLSTGATDVQVSWA